MLNSLPEIQINSNRDLKDKDKKNKQVSPKLNYQGITLREYFRMCQESRPNDSLKQIKEESRASSHSSSVETPCFNLQEKQRGMRGKIKTEICELDTQNQLRINTIKCGQNKATTHSLQKGQKGTYLPMKKKQDKKKIFSIIHSNTTRQQLEMANRCTLNSFYQVQENKKKMLKKVQQEKDRVNDFRLSDAFFVTKYGSKFKLDSKNIKNE